MHTVASQGVQENGQRGHQRLTFTGSHLGNLSLMQHDTTEKLHIVVNHVPHRVIASGCPMIVVTSRAALDFHEIILGGQFAVEIICRDMHFLVRGETLGCGFHDGEYHRHHFVQDLFVTLQHFLFQLVNLGKQRRAVFNRSFFHLGFHLGYLRLDIIGRRLHILFHFLRLGAQIIVAQRLNGGISLFYLFHQRLNQFHVAGGLVAKKLAQKLVYVHIVACF